MSYGKATLDHSSPARLMETCDGYLASRTGRYEWRAQRYRAAMKAMQELGLSHNSTVVDVGAGWTEFDYTLRAEGGYRCRYWPVDGCFDGTNLEKWVPPRKADFFVALELIEHLVDPWRFLAELQAKAQVAVIVSTPNPLTTDVLGMDATHKTEIMPAHLEGEGFEVTINSFYGQPEDSLFGVWTA